MTKIPIQELLKPFATSIFAKATALKSFEASNSLTKPQRARLNEAISDDIKKCTNFVTPGFSKAALEEATRIGIDLRQMNWHDQCRFDKARRIFHWEHMVPVKILRKACFEAGSEAEVLDVLLTKPRVVWLLKTEDSELTRLGFRTVREDPEAAYRAARIELIHLK
jgi:hypothetical protein